MENFTKIRAARAELLLEDGQTFFLFCFSPVPPHVLSDFVVSPRLWLKCNRLLKLGRPVGAVTLSR